MRIILLLLLLNFHHILAQDPSKTALSPCGAPAGLPPFLVRHHAEIHAMAAERSEDTLWVAIQPHLLAKDNGSGRIPWDRFLSAFCRLNQDFGPSRIQFYLQEPWNLLDNTSWHSHGDIPAGINMMLTNNVDDALNSYFVSDPAGNCGYNLPYAGVAIAHGCAGPADHTWAHEIGHALNLPHPFIGWEGKTYNFNLPTPQLLTYDYTYFHDTIDTQVPAPLDTALVEYVDGSNCTIAADLICDTKPDYLSYRWNCSSGTSFSSALQKDPDDVQFRSDGSLFMSYADDACQTRFSDEEIAVMRATLATEKAHWVATSMPLLQITVLPTPIEPVQNQAAPVSGAKLTWYAVPNATHYLVQASRIPSFGYKELDLITTDTSAICGTLTVNKTYYWRVRPFNMRDACQPFSETATFLTVPLTSAFEPDADGWRCYPSIMQPGQSLTLELPESWRGEQGVMQVFDLAGRQIGTSDFNCHSPEVKVAMPAANLSAGFYQCVIRTRHDVKRHTVFIQH